MKVIGSFLLTIILTIGMVSAISICIDNESPSAPAGLAVSGNSGNLLISWGAAIDSPDCSGILEYVISRDEIELARVAGDILNFIDNESLGEGEYDYTVHAIDMVGKNAGASVKNEIIINRDGESRGGSRSSSYECEVNWSCGNWSECIDGEEIRTCTDLNKCGTDYLKPDTTSECEIDVNYRDLNFSSMGPTEDRKNFFSTITGAVIGVISTPEKAVATGFITLALMGLIFITIKKKKKSDNKK